MQKCNVCCENYTTKKKKLVQCKFCGYGQCLQCVKRYLLSIQEEKCMNCNVRWDQEYIQEILPKTFINKEYKQQKQRLLIEEEKKYYPQYMQIIQDKRETEIINKKINQIKMDIMDKKKDYQKQRYKYRQIPYNVLCPRKGCNKQFVHIKCRKCRAEVCINCLGMREEGHVCEYITEEERKQIQKQLTMERKELREQIKRKQGGTKERQSREIQYQYIPCPKNGCKGYIQVRKNSQEEIRCVICETDVCRRCNKEKQGSNVHKCKEEDVISTQQITKECKQCPKCHINIYKIEGCNDMFCTLCKVSFNWRTGKEQRPAHNPHYYEYIRHNDLRQQNLEYRCGDGVDGSSVIMKLRRQKRNQRVINNIAEQSMQINHIQDVEILKLQNGLQQSNQDISIQYLQNQVGIKKYQKILFQRKKKKEKNVEYIQILETYVNFGQEIIEQIYSKQKRQSIDQEYEQLINLYNYIKENIDKARKKYNSAYQIEYFN